ncbi:MAG TPA: SDR family NAD(P)-dependent oxidoreductase, partial [Ramlibacter sp.]|nr:SDR family NAD(P)-dependent oxidoreductase [Ramlibacter sp.]
MWAVATEPSPRTPQPIEASMRLKGKSTFITGAGSGIGRAAALLFAQEGAQVTVAEIDEASGAETARQITQAGGQALFVRMDVTQAESMEQAVTACVQAFGKLDVLYNNAGVSTGADGPVTEVELDHFWKMIKLNLFGTWLGCRYAIPHIARAGGGSVINTVSIAALMGMRGMDAFTAAKGGVAAITRSMAVEFASQKVRVNAIAPTMILTERVRSLMDRPAARDVARMNLLGPGEPIDVAW